MSLLAIDIGSSRCKAVRFSASGKILTQCSHSYAPELSRPSFAEMSPEVFLDAVKTVSRSAAGSADHDPVQAVCLSSHGETFIPVNSAGNPSRPAILNTDTRAAEEAAWCEQQMGRRKLFEITGHSSHAMYPVPKLLWLRKNEPEIFRGTPMFLNVVSYVFLKLGLPPYVDYSHASRFMAFDIRRKCWSGEILSLLNIGVECLPIPVAAGTLAGKLSPEAARQLGVAVGTPMIVGGHDQACSCLGVGAITPGRVSDSMGTYECIAAASNEPPLSERALGYNLNSYCHVLPEKFITLAYFPAGIMLQWYYDLLYPENSGDTPGESEESRYRNLEQIAPQTPTGLFILPYLIGTCNPDFNPDARGAILGLTRRAHRGHLYKGILEGIACELSVMSEIFREILGDFDDIYAHGGGARSALGLQLRATITGRRFHLMRCAESVCLGSAILASVAIGLYSTIADAVKHMVQEVQVVEPDSDAARMYSPIRTQYGQLNSMFSTIRIPNVN